MASLEALLRLLGQPASSQAPSDADAEGRELEALALSLARQASAGDGAHDPASPPDASLRDVFLCLLYTSPSPRDQRGSRMPSSA